MNKITKIFNNIGFYCSNNNDIFIQNRLIAGYQLLDQNSIGYYIPYLVRNIKDSYKWEIGVGEVQYYDGNIIVKRVEVSNSSNNGLKVNFTGQDNEFYLFVNNSNFNSSFNNVILKNDNFTIDNVTSIYLVDNTEKNIDCVLPPVSNARNVVVDIKALSYLRSVIIRHSDGSIFDSTNSSIRLVCDGQTWYILNQNDQANYDILSTEPFSAQSNPGGSAYSFQYNDGSNGLLGAEAYWSSGNTNKLLLGSSSELLAHSVIPASGDADTIFNQDLKNSDFIVYGSGQPYRNLFFSYDGRVGINIPSGSRPQTIFHVVNYSCSEILRLENRTSCQPAKFTIYHKPSVLTNGNICSIVNLAGRDSDNNQKDYAQLYSIASNTTDGYGGIVLSISSGNNQQSIISGTLDNINIGYGNNNRLNITNTGVDLRSSSTNIIGTSNTYAIFNNTNRNITLDYSTLSLGSGTTTSNGTISTNNLAANSITLPNISPSSLLTLSSNRTIIPISGITVNSGNNGLILNNISGNRFLTTDSNQNIVGSYSLDDYFLTEQDIIWNKYQPRSASVCLKQITFDNPVPVEEFAIGDQIEIVTTSSRIYRNISSVIANENNITELLLDQNVTSNEISNITVASITKGGYLVIQKSAEGGVSDSTSNIISVRPKTETVFNTAQKDIDFTIYGKDINPAFKVHASVGSLTTVSGIYYNYATKEDTIKPIVINTVGSGLTNNFSSANFNYTLANNLFSGVLSSVGTNGRSSYYGTYDQNGNVAEWLESDRKDGIISYEFVAGGSIRTPKIGTIASDSENIYLRSVQRLPISSVFDYVGFRVASISNLSDNNNILSPSNLNLSFVNIVNPNNIRDTGVLYEQTNISFSLRTVPNLGVVDKPYRISRYEITNDQYIRFLNSVATGVSNPITSGLYNINMTNSVIGGIARSGNGLVYEYSAKDNMGNKPVNYVSYINSLQFINWLHNDAPFSINPDNANKIINDGAYTILLAGSNYYVTTNKNKKYHLPTLHQWHKSAYFEYQESVIVSGSPAITIGTQNPYVVATEKITEIGGLSTEITQNPRQILANLTVSGWLVVDKIIVRDGTVRSSLKDIGFVPDLTQNQIAGLAIGDKPPLPDENGGSSSDTFWNNNTSSSWGGGGGVFGETEPPPLTDGDGTEDEADCEAEDIFQRPFWCDGDGLPDFFPK